MTKTVLTYCDKKLLWWFFEIQGWRLRICKNFEIPRTICLNSDRSEQYLVTESFLTCSWRFLRYDKVEQLGFKLKKNYWDLETCMKSSKLRHIWTCGLDIRFTFYTWVKLLVCGKLSNLIRLKKCELWTCLLIRATRVIGYGLKNKIQWWKYIHVWTWPVFDLLITDKSKVPQVLLPLIK